MKRVFNDKDQWSKEGLAISTDIETTLQGIMTKYSEYSIRDIGILLHHATSIVVTMNIISSDKDQLQDE
jgi:hypothetical protein